MLEKLTLFIVFFFLHHVYGQSVIEVSATRLKDYDPYQNLTVEILNDQFEQQKYSNAHQIFKELVGISTNETFLQLFLRGGETYHTLVMVDGVRLNDPSLPNRSFDLNQLRFLDIKKIKIFKGPSAALFGEGISGAIVIETKTGKQQKTNIVTGYGSYQKYLVALNTGVQKEKLQYFMQTNYETQEGKTQKNSPTGKDEKDAKKFTQIGFNTQYDLSSRYRVGLLTKLNNDYQEIDSWQGDQSGYYNQNKMMMGKLNFDFEFNKEIDSNSFSYNYSNHHRFTNDDWQKKFKSEIHVLKFQSKLRLSDYQHLTGELTFKQEKDLSPGSRTQRTKNNENDFAFIHAVSFFPVETTYSFRFTRNEMKSDLMNFFVRNTVAIFKLLIVGYQFGNSHQIPSLYQLSDIGYGNPDLKIEQSQSYEAFFQIKKVGFSYQQSFYLTRIKDRFSYDPQTYQTLNGDRAEIRGIESTVAFQAESGVEFGTSYERLMTFAYETKKQLPRRPAYKHSGYIKISEFSLRGMWVGRSDDLDGVNSSYYDCDFLYQKNLSKNLTVTVSVNNLLNHHYYEVLGYSSKERTFFMQFEGKI